MLTTHHHLHATPLASAQVDVTRHVITAPVDLHVPYEGDNPLVKAAFPDGFLPGYGSGLAFKEIAANGDLLFYCLTDRGPNGEGPNVPDPDGQGTRGSKIFPAPSFAPAIGILRLSPAGARLESSIPLRISSQVTASGLPLAPGALGSSAEIPVLDALRFDPASKASFAAGGIDSEAIAYDVIRDALWVADEYGPFLLKIDPATGIVQHRYGPGSGLPEVLALRRANRGMEGMTLDPASERLHAFLQSPLSDGEAHHAETGKTEKVERHARFLRWIEFNPASGKTERMLAYPLDGADYADGRTGNAKLGDMVALGDGNFIVIEQGMGRHGAMLNQLMLVEIGDASNISGEQFNPATSDLEKSSMCGEPVKRADWAAVKPMKKTVLLNLNSIGWAAEKAEGLALVDAHTLAMTNDNDFGLKARLYDASGMEIQHAEMTDIDVDNDGKIVSGAAATDTIRIDRGDAHERALTLWLLNFKQPLASFVC